jgi:hypothetical protein
VFFYQDGRISHLKPYSQTGLVYTVQPNRLFRRTTHFSLALACSSYQLLQALAALATTPSPPSPSLRAACCGDPSVSSCASSSWYGRGNVLGWVILPLLHKMFALCCDCLNPNLSYWQDTPSHPFFCRFISSQEEC